MIYRKMVFVSVTLIIVLFQAGCYDFSNDSKPLAEENVLKTELNEPNLRQLLLNPQEENQKLIKENSKLRKENEQLKKLIDEYNTDVSFSQFDLQDDLILIRENYNVSMNTKQLGLIENSIDIGITSEEALELQIKASESFVEYQIYFPKGKLPTEINIREAYLSNLALSLMTGLRELKIETIIFMEDDKEIAEYHLEDLI